MSQGGSFGNGGGGGGTDLHVAKLIVNSTPNAGGNYTTITAAMAAAVSGDTIFVMPGATGTYTENFALKAGVNITAFDCDAETPNVRIIGKMTANFAGSASISGIFLENGSDNILSISGASLCIINFIQCFISVAGASYALLNTNANGVINLFYCQGTISGTSAYFNVSGAAINIQYSYLFNGSNSTTSNLLSNNAAINLIKSTLNSMITSSGSASIGADHSNMILTNTQAISCGGAVMTNLFNNCRFESGTATAISVGAGSTLTVSDISVHSSNAAAISGAGTLKYGPITFTSTSSNVTTSTATPLRFGPAISPVMTDTNGTVVYDGTILGTVAPGTAGNVLTSNGAGSPPSYQAAGGGGGITEYFSTYLGSPHTNVTGDGTIYNIPFDGIITNSSSSYNAGTGLYTAPTAGQYCFTHTVVFDVATTSDSFLSLWNGSGFSSRAFQTGQFNPAVGGIIFSATIFIQMGAGDTMGVSALAGGGTKTVSIYGSAPSGFATTSLFSGFRVAT